MSAKELAKEIRVNSIALGAILAPEDGIDHSLIGEKPVSELKKIDRSLQVANLVEYLVNNNYISGAIIPLDNALHLTNSL